MTAKSVEWRNAHQTYLAAHIATSVVLVAMAVGCSGGSQKTDAPPGATVLQIWAHSGQASERETLEALVNDFNAHQEDVYADITFLPDGSYNAQVQSAALADELPDVLEFDGPYLYNYVWRGHLIPLTPLISEDLLGRVIPSIIEQGTFRGELYSLGMFDSGLGLYASRAALEKIGARIPNAPQDAWTVEEFETILAKLAKIDDDGAVLDLKLNYTGEWYAYAFAPVLWSAGAALIDRTDFDSASGVLDSDSAVEAMTHLQSWMYDRKYVDPNIDDNAFVSGRVALSWVGHWEYPRYEEKLGDDLVVVPLPDFGKGTRTGQGSWNWGVTTKCSAPASAAAFVSFLMADDNVFAMAQANGAVPATDAAIQRSEAYAEGGDLRLFVDQLRGGYARPRARTPAYPVMSTVFQNAFRDIRDGADVRAALNQAAQEIDQDIRANQGYPAVEGVN
jgi:multiple sugar transport system substrate-binding protein